MVMFNVFLFSALKTITAIRSSIMLAFTPVVVAIAAFFLFKEKINKIMVVGIFLSIGGVIITVTSGDVGSVIAHGLSVGDIFMILAVLSWAFYSIVIKSAIARISPLAALSYGALIGIVILLPFTFIEKGWATLHLLTLPSLFSLLYLGFFSAGIAYLWYFQGIKEIGSSAASVFLILEPVAAILIGLIFLKELLTLPLFLGALLVMTGLFLTNYRSKVKKELL
jgi:drug/metabolite transporter (DMT)-like permease